MVIFQCMQILCSLSPAHSYTSVTKKEQQNEDNDKISLRQTFELSSDR